MECEFCKKNHDGSYGGGRFCCVKCAKAFSTKNKRKEINEKISKANKGRKLSLKHKKKISEANKNRTDELKKQIGKSVSKFYKNNPEAIEKLRKKMTGKVATDETKKKLSELAKKRGFGGVTQSRWIYYKDKKLGSTYEYNVVVSLDENNIKWDTCTSFKYIDDKGKKRTYTPDLYLIDYDVYLDPKNDFLIENINPSLAFKDVDKIKWCSEQNNIKIIILNKDQLNWNIIKNMI